MHHFEPALPPNNDNHPHHLGVSPFVIDTTTQPVGRPFPRRYSVYCIDDGLVLVWHLTVPMGKHAILPLTTVTAPGNLSLAGSTPVADEAPGED